MKRTPYPLTAKEKMVLEFIEDHIKESGISPSYTEIKDHFNFASINSVQNYLKQLSNKGYIHIPGDNQKRAIQVLNSASSVKSNLLNLITNPSIAPASSPSTQPTSMARSPRNEPLLGLREEVLSLPLLGKVAAGRPIEALNHDEFIDVPPSLVKNPSRTFALKVQGSSMIEDGIHDGDYIFVQKQSVAINGEIIVAVVENEATVKRFYHYPKHEPEKQIELRPSNSQMSSMWYHPSDVEIRGVLVGLIRKF